MLAKQWQHAFPVAAIGRQLAGWLMAIIAYGVAVRFIVNWWDIRLPEWGASAGLIDGVVLGLLLSFRNRACYERWWEGRRLWGHLINDSRNLACKFAAFIPADVLARSGAPELFSDFAEAMKRQLRSAPASSKDPASFKAEKAETGPTPTQVAGRLYAIVAGWRRDGLLDDATLWVLDTHLRALLDSSGGCEKIHTTPLSPSYKALLRTGIAINLLLGPWYAVAELGYWGVPVFSVVCFFLLGVELIDTIVEEPFGPQRDELDLDAYCRVIRDSVKTAIPATSQGAYSPPQPSPIRGEGATGTR